uniref:C-type lectin domain-containing protein n=1 Tax=Chelonoidis abingdonii TaxID=106734 RepID=A0A8C0G9X1_CHEAB
MTAGSSAPILFSETASHHTVLFPLPIPSLGSGIGATSCPPEWLFYQGHCYAFFPEEVQCQYHRKGAHLASIITKAEGNTVARYITESGATGHVWIGLHDPRQVSAQSLRWTWTYGSLYRYSRWNVGEPYNLNDSEYCIELLKGTGFKNWNDQVCNRKNGYVCKYGL